MATESAYLLRNNIMRYEALLKDPDTTVVTRKTLETLITEARVSLQRVEIRGTDR
jgi:hypothetical protein